jgi:hypothetical protein
MKHVKLFEQFVNEKAYQLTGIYGAKGIPGKVLYAFKKEVERVKYLGDATSTLNDINKVWSKWADKEGAKIIETEVLKQVSRESIVYIVATLSKSLWVVDDVENINKPGNSELLVRIPSDFVINVGFMDDVDGSKFSRKLDGMMNHAIMIGKETNVLGTYDAQVYRNNVEIRESLFLTIDAK